MLRVEMVMLLCNTGCFTPSQI